MFGFMKKRKEIHVEALSHELAFERVGDTVAIRREESKVTLLFSPSRWGGKNAVDSSWIHKREFPSMSALKRWCRVHHPCKFWPTQEDKKIENVVLS
jgi:hypothetical protein